MHGHIGLLGGANPLYLKYTSIAVVLDDSFARIIREKPPCRKGHCEEIDSDADRE